MLRSRPQWAGAHTRALVDCTGEWCTFECSAQLTLPGLPTKRLSVAMVYMPGHPVLVISMGNCENWISELTLCCSANVYRSAPIYKHLGTGWEKAFQRRLPQVLRTCATAFQKALRAFHEDLETQTRARSGVNPRLGMLAQQLQAYEAVFADLANNMVVTINLSQKEVNREFTPSICQAMEQAYALCAAERGKIRSPTSRRTPR